MATYTLEQLAKFIDHTNLKADATHEDMVKLCDEANRYQFKMVAINSGQSNRCSQLLSGTGVDIGAAIGFPLGQTSIASKVFETEEAIQSGATEIDYMINITELKAKNYAFMEEEMAQIVAVCRKHNICSKVIFENCYLTKEEIIKMSEIAKKVKPDFIKTSTGFGTGGATFEDVQLMKQTAGDEIKVKAAGGIRDVDTFLKMIASGAERIGTSSGILIIEELKSNFAKQGITEIDI
ncbi:deoxyribose-phosphate aldolase [Carnobacterium gallinarum]|uniref:deoxyribose-phosphate aldolase n=1 Tax=Carnobacterium gallinarum TaxID=2749 RepID=UPI0005507E93|nr:deoxyribose-phosphate aldolase [Carnobacterium gallinarum]